MYFATVLVAVVLICMATDVVHGVSDCQDPSPLRDRLGQLERLLMGQSRLLSQQHHLLRQLQFRLSHQEELNRGLAGKLSFQGDLHLQLQSTVSRLEDQFYRQDYRFQRQDKELFREKQLNRQQAEKLSEQEDLLRQLQLQLFHQENVNHKQDVKLLHQEQRLGQQSTQMSHQGYLILQQSEKLSQQVKHLKQLRTECADDNTVLTALDLPYVDSQTNCSSIVSIKKAVTLDVQSRSDDPGPLEAVVNVMEQQLTEMTADIQALKNSDLMLKTQTDTQIQAVKNETDTQIQALKNSDQMLKTQTDAQIQAVKNETDTQIQALKNSDLMLKTQTDTQIQAVKNETDTQIQAVKNETDTQIQALKNSDLMLKTQTDAQIQALNNSDQMLGTQTDAQIQALKTKTNSQLQTLKTETDTQIQMLNNTNLQQDQAIQDAQSSTFIHWGSSQCSNASQLVYSGVVGGSQHDEPGAATNYLCLTMSPVPSDRGLPPAMTYLYGGEYETRDSHEHKDPVCAVCLSRHSTTIMIPGTNVCTQGWHQHYNGFLMAGKYDQSAGSEFICVDSRLEIRPGSERMQHGRLLYFTASACGSLPCGPYINNKLVTCVVCSK